MLALLYICTAKKATCFISRYYPSAIKAVLRSYYGCMTALFRRYYTYMRIYIRVCVYVCVNEAADEGHMKMSVACVSYTALAGPCAYTHTHTHTHTHNVYSSNIS